MMTDIFTFEMLFKIGGFAISVFLFSKGIYEYIKTQKWKKAEFVSNEIKEFLKDFDVKRALILLDWNSNVLYLEKGEIDNKSSFYFDDNLILSSLKTHQEISRFSDEEVIIKKSFDCLLDKLVMFEYYIQAGLINSNDIKPYLIYWIKIIADKNNERKSREVRIQIWKYINEYYAADLVLFFNRFGYSIR